MLPEAGAGLLFKGWPRCLAASAGVQGAEPPGLFGVEFAVVVAAAGLRAILPGVVGREKPKRLAYTWPCPPFFGSVRTASPSTQTTTGPRMCMLSVVDARRFFICTALAARQSCASRWG